MGVVIYGVVFGTRAPEATGAPANVTYLNDAKPSTLSPSGTIYWPLIPYWDWPSDTEPPNEPA